MALIGGVTIIIGAVLAFVQRDIKKVLAYSTISQLGYMIMGLGVGAWVAAVFHLFTHAFFKALLFLGAGSVSHGGTHHSFDMKADMGGLRKFMPITFWTFIIGSLALAGIFPLAGFWSKDEILVNAGNNGFDVFLVIGLIGAFLTAAYMTRCVYLTFFGEYRGHGHPHESERAITVPLIVLAAFSILIGLINAAPLGIEKFTEWVEPTVNFPDLVHAEFDYPKAIISVTIALLGIGIAAFFWFRKEELGPLKGLTQPEEGRSVAEGVERGHRHQLELRWVPNGTGGGSGEVWIDGRKVFEVSGMMTTPPEKDALELRSASALGVETLRFEGRLRE